MVQKTALADRAMELNTTRITEVRFLTTHAPTHTDRKLTIHWDYRATCTILQLIGHIVVRQTTFHVFFVCFFANGYFHLALYNVLTLDNSVSIQST